MSEFKVDENGEFLLDEEGNKIPVEDNTPSLEQLESEQRKIVEALVAEQLKDIKDKLDNSYGKRDDALREAARLREEKKAAEIEALKQAGKVEEAVKIELTEAQEQLRVAKEQITKLTRDQQLSDALSAAVGDKEFRSPRAREMAFSEIVSQLVQDDSGNWAHRTGAAIQDYVKAFASDEEYEYLFKPKVNKGTQNPGNPDGLPKFDKGATKLADLSQEDVLKLASMGKLGQKSF